MTVRPHRVDAFTAWLDTLPPNTPWPDIPGFRFFRDITGDEMAEAIRRTMKRDGPGAAREKLPMTEDQLNEYAGRIAATALTTTGDAMVAGRVLFQAMATILVSRLGPAAASAAIREMSGTLAEGISNLPDITETRQ